MSACRVVAQQRDRRVEPERLRQGVPGEVDDHANRRQRRGKPDPEREDSHVLEARICEQPLPCHRPPQEGDRDRQRHQPEREEHGLGDAVVQGWAEGVEDAPGDQDHDR